MNKGVPANPLIADVTCGDWYLLLNKASLRDETALLNGIFHCYVYHVLFIRISFIFFIFFFLTQSLSIYWACRTCGHFPKLAVYVILLTCQKPVRQHKNPPTARDTKHQLCRRGFCGLGQGGRRSFSIKTGLLNGKCNILLLHGHASYCLITM